MSTFEVLGVDHIDLTVTDQARSIVFYEKVLRALGFRRLPLEHYVAWGNAQVNIAVRPVAPEERGARFNRYRAGLHHLALKAKCRADVDGFYQFLRREGITVLDAPAEYPQYGPQYYAVFFADPDGMKIELVHFPWGYWRKVQSEGSDRRPRYAPRHDS
jgi:catechol 2,3-dioxygenase-like lactoylglutathione lyase family enzyme